MYLSTQIRRDILSFEEEEENLWIFLFFFTEV